MPESGCQEPRNENELVPLLRIYHSYMKTLGFELLPELVYRTLGSMGFGSLARLYATATRRYIDEYMPGCERDPVRLLEEMRKVAMAARDVLGGEPLFNFTIDVSDSRLAITAPMKVETPVDRLRAAVVLGIVAGVLEASGYQVYIVTDVEKARKLLDPGKVILYLDESQAGEARIVAEYAGGSGARR